MEVFKDFLQRLRKLTFEEIYIILNDDTVPHLAEFVKYLKNVKYEDGFYHTYYGEVKNIISGFLNYFSKAIDDMVIEADKCSHVMTREELLILAQKTIDINYDRQIFFGKNFLPVGTMQEKDAYEEIEKMFEHYKDKLVQLKDTVEKFDKQEKVDKFCKEHFQITLKKTREMFDFAHVFISLMLADRLHELKVSLEEILLRTRNNLKKNREEQENAMHDLLHELYDKNKVYLQITRRNRKCSVDIAEVDRSIQMIHHKIREYKNMHTLQRIQDEVCYWETQLERFNEIADELLKLKAEQENVIKQEKIYNTMRSTELPGSKMHSWLAMGENFHNRRVFLKDKIIEVARTLITFFSFRGVNRILYKNHVGEYFMDDYNHKVYVFNNGMNLYHVNCDGDLKEVHDTDKYYFDTNGRYVFDENGEKIYQCDACTSSYRLTEDNLLKKITQDCGHAESLNEKCRLQFYKPTIKTEMLPDITTKDIKGTLEPEVVKYLWNSFGHVLPNALHDVGVTQPMNPIQHLAHKILLHKCYIRYNKTFSEFLKKTKEAEEYRDKIHEERKKKAIETSKAWKAKQVKRRKPEESDDTENRAILDAQKAAQEHIMSLNYYYD